MLYTVMQFSHLNLETGCIILLIKLTNILYSIFSGKISKSW